jgi:hypothetical protein
MQAEEVIIGILKDRRQMYDQLVWQIPLLAVTAERFLFLISLGTAVSETARIISSGLGIIIALVSVLTFDRLKTCELYDSFLLNEILRKKSSRAGESTSNQTAQPNTFSCVVDETMHEIVIGPRYLVNRAYFYKEKRWMYKDKEKSPDLNNGVDFYFYWFTSHFAWLACFVFIVFANVIILVIAAIQQQDKHNSI